MWFVAKPCVSLIGNMISSDRFFELMDDMELIVMDLERVDVSILERYSGILSDRCKVLRNDLDSILRGNYEGFRDDEVSSINSFLSVALDHIYN